MRGALWTSAAIAAQHVFRGNPLTLLVFCLSDGWMFMCKNLAQAVLHGLAINSVRLREKQMFRDSEKTEQELSNDVQRVLGRT